MLGTVGASLGTWARKIDANDSGAALIIDQRGSGNLLEVKQGGTTLFTIENDGDVILGGSVTLDLADDEGLLFGSDDDIFTGHVASATGANTVITGKIIGTPVTPAIAANSFIITNITADGDYLLALNNGGNSQAWQWVDSSGGTQTLYAAGVARVLLNSTGGSFTGTWSDLGTVTTVDINGGTIDGTTIGATSATSVIGTTIDATTDFTIGATVITDGVLTDASGFQIAAVLDMANNAINNIAAAGNDFGATQLDLAASYTILGANGLTISTTTGDMSLEPVGHIGLLDTARASDQVSVLASAETTTVKFSRFFILGASAGAITVDTNAVDIYTLRLQEPNITIGTGSVPLSAVLQIDQVPTEATDNFAIHVASGVSGFGIDTEQNVNASGAILAAGGIAFTDVLNAWIDDATHGSGTTTHYIGNQTIDTTASDVRLKTKWSAPNGLAKEHLGILANALEEYNYLPGNLGGERFVGFGAQHLATILPQYVVEGNADNHWSVEYKYMVGPLLWGWQEHDERIKELEAQVLLLGGKV